jgi:DNA-binding SARP family transcriptional activator
MSMLTPSLPAHALRVSSAAGPQPVRLRFLGGLQLEGQHRGPESGYETRHHVRAVLALAGASQQGIGRDELVDALWPGSSAAAGRNRLYHTVHLARQALAEVSWDDEWLAVRAGRVQLDERVWCDVRQLEQAIDRGTARLGPGPLHELLPLCANDWMPGLEIGALGQVIRARVRRHQSDLLREAITRQGNEGDTPTHRALLQSLLRLEATDEWAHRQLMRLDLAAGRRHAVLRTFEKLGRELGA